MVFYFEINGDKMTKKELTDANTGSAGYYKCEFDFKTEDWEGLSKFAVFIIDNNPIPVEITDGECDIPVQSINSVGSTFVGVYGTNADANALKRISTNFEYIKVSQGAYSVDNAPEPPAPDLWEIYYAKVKGEVAEAQSIKTDVTALKNETKGYRDESEVSKNSSLESSYQASQHADLAISASEEAETERLLAQQAKTEAQQAKAETDRNRQIVEQYVTNLPTRYFKKSVAEMEAITGAKNVDVCYITNFTDGETAQYIYDTMDIDGDSKNPEWLFLGNLPYLVIDRDTLFGILQLPTVAISGSYPDLTNKPSRYEPFTGLDGTAGTIVWDFSTSCNAYVTLSGTKPLQITNISNGGVGVLKVFGGDIILPSNSEPVPPDFDYLPLQDGQYWEYVFDYDGVNFSWTRRVKNMAVISNE